MVSPDGRFFDDTKGRHNYSDPILQVGVEAAWRQITFHLDRHLGRGGHYDGRTGHDV